MLQIIKAALKDPEDKTQLSLIFANVNEEDILLRQELNSLVKQHASRFKVYFVLNNVSIFPLLCDDSIWEIPSHIPMSCLG